MRTWAINYDGEDYVLRGDAGDYIFANYESLVKFAKTLDGENKIFDIPTEGIIELYFGIVTKLDTHAQIHDSYLKRLWA